MNSLYTLGVRQTSSIEADLEKMRSGDSSTALHGQVAASLSALTRTADNLDTMAKRETVQAKQEKAQMRVQKFRADYADLKMQFETTKAVAANEQATVRRSELFQSSSGAAISPSDARRRVGQMQQAENSESPFQNRSALPNASFRESHALHEHSFIDRTESQLDDFIAQGREVLDNLVDQGKILKGTHKRILDAANTLGFSKDVIGWIERRSKQDTYIFIFGAVFTFFSFYWIWRWFG